MIESKCSITQFILSAHKEDVRNKSEARILTQEEGDEQIRNIIALLTKELEDLFL